MVPLEIEALEGANPTNPDTLLLLKGPQYSFVLSDWPTLKTPV